MFFDGLARYLLQFHIAVIQQVRIKDRLLKVCVHHKLTPDRTERIAVVAVLVGFDLCKQFFDLAMVRFEHVDRILRRFGSATGKYIRH